jgi:hypothetical protein
MMMIERRRRILKRWAGPAVGAYAAGDGVIGSDWHSGKSRISSVCIKGLSLAFFSAVLMLRMVDASAEDESTPTAAVPMTDAASTRHPLAQSPDDAWWTGPLLASTAATMPQGHFYMQPYLYDGLPYARLDNTGHSHAVTHQNDFGSQTYINYGVTDLLTVGLIPRFGYDSVDGGPSSTGIGVGDPSVQMQYRLTQFQPDSWTPTISINLQESLPIGRYDRLQRPNDGFGSGAWTTSLGAYFQSLFWMPNGRILRARLDLSYAASAAVSVDGLSVYGTPVGFHGHANPGGTAYVDLAVEFSATRNWVLACDLWLERDGNTHVQAGTPLPGDPGSSFDSGAARELIVAPALEYNWSARAGIIFGARVIAAGRNTTASVTPVAAFSYFL